MKKLYILAMIFSITGFIAAQRTTTTTSTSGGKNSGSSNKSGNTSRNSGTTSTYSSGSNSNNSSINTSGSTGTTNRNYTGSTYTTTNRTDYQPTNSGSNTSNTYSTSPSYSTDNGYRGSSSSSINTNDVSSVGTTTGMGGSGSTTTTTPIGGTIRGNNYTTTSNTFNSNSPTVYYEVFTPNFGSTNNPIRNFPPCPSCYPNMYAPPIPGYRVHFSGALMSDMSKSYADGWTREIFESDDAGEMLGIGQYPYMDDALVRSSKTTLDGIAIDSNVRLIVYSKENFMGDILIDITGPAIINNGYRYNSWNDITGQPNDKTYYGPLQNQFPQQVRGWSQTNMNQWPKGSMIIMEAN